MKLFDNKVQETKYKVLREVAYQTWRGNDVFAEFNEIANNVQIQSIGSLTLERTTRKGA